MKALLCLTALVALQLAAAKPSTPIEGCQRTAIVPDDGSIKGCDDFAALHKTNFQKLRDWNYDLRSDCANLDTKNTICVMGPANGDTVKTMRAKTPVAPASAKKASSSGPAAAAKPPRTKADPLKPSEHAPSKVQAKHAKSASPEGMAKAGKSTTTDPVTSASHHHPKENTAAAAPAPASAIPKDVVPSTTAQGSSPLNLLPLANPNLPLPGSRLLGRRSQPARLLQDAF